MTSHAPFRRIGWIALFIALAGLTFALHVKVQAVYSDVVRAERQIVALEQEKLLLATEFETRASQLQLAAWNRVDFGYSAPTADQFLDAEVQLAALGTRGLPGFGAPVQLARAEAEPSEPQPGTTAPAEIDAGEAEIRLATARLGGPTGRIALAALAEPVAE
jgi:hypothetical protein